MNTQVEIKSITGRAYVEYYFDGIRQREYNGNKLSLSIFPNKASSQSDKLKLLKKLKYEFEKALEKGWNPLTVSKDTNIKLEKSLEESIQDVLTSKLSGEYSRTYKGDLERLAKKLLEFLTTVEKRRPIDELGKDRILEFLKKFSSSNRNYMNKRQTLNVLLPGTIIKTERKKCVEKLHAVYSKEEMKKILVFLRQNYPKLHMVALLAYGCFLRPHEESRLLQKRNINEQRIYLSGEENKGKKVRVMPIPDYIYRDLLLFIEQCEDASDYIFTGSGKQLNNDYFRTQWSRAKKRLIEMGLIHENQTLYSFRHSGAVNVYRKTKDVYLIQNLLGHTSITVTIKYLRGLGEFHQDYLKDVLPDL